MCSRPPRADVSVGTWGGIDWREEAVRVIDVFRGRYHQNPNYLGVTLAQVEGLEAKTGGGAIYAFFGVPLLFVSA